MKLVIVESPTKCTTIKRYLGDEYEVKASLGHICDLATSGKGGLGVDVDNNFKPIYVISSKKHHVVNELTTLARKADEVILATDPDREGEAIAWHLARTLKLPIESTKRLEFHEITRESITNAMKTPRTINMDLVESQEARRILDRIIGFKLSTLMYKKIRSRSAGRVQSATLKLIADHDNEIAKFVPEEYWVIHSSIDLNGHEMNLSVYNKNGKEIDIKNKDEADAILAKIPQNLVVSDAKRTIRTKESKEPFTTSTLQQEAFSRLKFKTNKTQFIAQKLYEGINVGDEHMGLITYMRTDSARLSPTFIGRAQSFIKETYGEDFVGKVKKSKEGEFSQDAHEAIRPTSNHRTPESVKKYLSNDEYKLYKLIYNRALGSLMKPKKEEVLTISFEVEDLIFKFEVAKTIFPGYEILKDYDEEENKNVKNVPDINVGDSFTVLKKESEQKMTQPPAPYSEARVVKIMEEVGIGRPSTYASTIEILRKRKYVEDNNGILVSTDQGKKTAHVLDKYFPDIVNVTYTAQMEEKLDSISEGDVTRNQVLTEFYTPFIELLDSVSKIMYVDDLEQTGEMCPKCGAPLVYKDGKNGKFIGCSNYPTCRYVLKEAKEPLKETGEICPICGKPLVERTKNGKTFIACSGYPKCKYVKKEEQPAQTYTEADYVKICPECGGHLVKKKGKYGSFLGCTNYPACNHMEPFGRKRRK